MKAVNVMTAWTGLNPWSFFNVDCLVSSSYMVSTTVSLVLPTVAIALIICRVVCLTRRHAARLTAARVTGAACTAWCGGEICV